MTLLYNTTYLCPYTTPLMTLLYTISLSHICISTQPLSRQFITYSRIKAKHKTRRIIQVNVLQCLSQLLSPGGLLIIASDVEDMMIDAKEKLNECDHLFVPITVDHPLVIESIQGGNTILILSCISP